MRYLIPIFLLSLCSVGMFAQVPIEDRKNVFFAPSDSQRLAFNFVSRNFFKNNEYFSTLHEGNTLPGFQASPTFVYYPGHTTRIEAGASFLKFFGRDGFYRVEPVFRFQYQPVAWFQTILGTLYGGSEHGIIEPLYQWERAFIDPLENGVQFLVATRQVKADVWLNWEKFIVANDPFQEELTFGTTFNWNLTPESERFAVSVPFQTLVNHRGGQIISVDMPLRTLLNYATGVKVELNRQGNLLKGINLQLWYLGFNDFSPQKLQAFKQGYALYPRLEAFVKNFTVQGGYYHGDMFVAPKGEALFHNATIPFTGEKRGAGNLITAKIAYRKIIARGLSFSTYLETYTNTGVSQTDYCYGLHLAMDRAFFFRGRVK